MPRFASTPLLRAAAFVAVTVAVLGGIRPRDLRAATPVGTDPQTPTCPVLISASNTGALPLILDVALSGYSSPTGDSASFAQGPGSPPATVRLPASVAPVPLGTRQVFGACGTARRYRFVFRNARGDTRVLFYPSPTTYSPATSVMLGDVQRIF